VTASEASKTILTEFISIVLSAIRKYCSASAPRREY
jgi:hypothetical protein